MKIKQIGIWAGIAVVLIAGVWGLIAAVNNSPSPSTPVEIKNLPEVSDQDFVRGNKSASGSAVTLIEYGDFQCPACGNVYPLVKQLETEFKDKLKVVYRFFPLISIHKNAMLAAQAAYAAGKQNKFWEMHDMLYENQNSWADTSPKDTFIDYAKKLGLNLEKFKTDLDSDSTKQFINDQEGVATSIGINSTPTFFVNKNHIQNPAGYDAFKKIIQDEIEAR